ncbi:MAG TPA: hypothetical protein VMB82_08435 [Acidimicrobiales bacterium]|nr:hypothetical protein [Acidimicrobiales bacterium]
MRAGRIERLAVVCALGLAAAGAGLVAASGVAGATGTTTSFEITVNGDLVTAGTLSSTATLAESGLPGDATGSVSFVEGATTLCTATLPLTSCTTGDLSTGTYVGISATYSGDGTYAGSISRNSVDLAVGSSISCKKFFGHLSTTVVAAKCGLPKTSAHVAGADLLTGGTLTWGKNGPTTVYTGSATSPGQGACKAGHVEEDFTGSVTGGTSTLTAIGDVVAFSVCVNSTNQLVKQVPRTLDAL